MVNINRSNTNFLQACNNDKNHVKIRVPFIANTTRFTYPYNSSNDLENQQCWKNLCYLTISCVGLLLASYTSSPAISLCKTGLFLYSAVNIALNCRKSRETNYRYYHSLCIAVALSMTRSTLGKVYEFALFFYHTSQMLSKCFQNYRLPRQNFQIKHQLFREILGIQGKIEAYTEFDKTFKHIFKVDSAGLLETPYEGDIRNFVGDYAFWKRRLPTLIKISATQEFLAIPYTVEMEGALTFHVKVIENSLYPNGRSLTHIFNQQGQPSIQLEYTTECHPHEVTTLKNLCLNTELTFQVEQTPVRITLGHTNPIE